jgi:uncharacterized protein (UPF0335 family)
MQLRQFIERVERLEEEKSGIAQDIREVMTEAKMNGFDTKIIRQVLRLRKLNRDERREQEELLTIYLNALGMAEAAAASAVSASSMSDDGDQVAA